MSEDGVTFGQVVAMANADNELLDEFTRLTGVDWISHDGSLNSDTGKLFLAFCYECIWLRMPEHMRREEVTPDPDAMRLWEDATKRD